MGWAGVDATGVGSIGITSANGLYSAEVVSSLVWSLVVLHFFTFFSLRSVNPIPGGKVS